jgi:diguanylate cyclase (GGDEF)-like protein/PAS domain S-box-containing protein
VESPHLLTHVPSPPAGQRARALPPELVPIAIVVSALCAAHLITPDGLVGTLSYLSVIVGAGVVALVSAARRGGPVRWLLAIGVALSSLADLIWSILAHALDTEPDVSAADVPWLAAYIALALGILLLLRRGRPGRGADVDGIIDMTVTAVAAGLILWQFWLDPLFSDSSVSMFIRSVWASYPVLDIALLALVVRMLVQQRSQTLAGALLAGGLLCWLFSDLAYFMASPTGLLSDLLDLGWMAGATLLAGACWNATDTPPEPTVTADDGRRLGKARIALTFAPLLVPALIEMIAFVRHEDANPIPLIVGTTVLTILAGVRAFRLLYLRDLAEGRLASSERLYRALAANASDAVMMLDANGCILNDAPHLAELVGYPGAVTRGRRALDFVSDEDAQSEGLFHETLLSPGVVLAGESHVSHPGGTDLWLATRAVNLLHDPDVHCIVVNVHDITDRKRVEEELLHQAFHDSLTGLANRALFRDRVEHALVRRGRSGSDPAVIYLDLDGFKHVNDGLGHEAGDNLLREVGTRLLSIVRSGDTVARLGGDEFAILVEQSAHMQIETEAIAERVLQTLTAPVDVGGQEVTLSASLGIALADPDSTASQLLRDADIAMYQAKTTGKARWVLYDPSMRAMAVVRLQLDNDMPDVIAKDQLRLVYQPVVELETERIVGFEALVRWEHPELGTVVPDRFVPIAEENGLIIPIGEWVLEQACATAAQWIARHRMPLTMAVNISACQLLAPDLVDQVRRALRRAGLEPQSLVLELTESTLVKDPELAASRLHELHALGVRLAIDDFGTGFSSLSYLRQFPVDILKIDQSFVGTIAESETVPAIVRGLLALGRTLNLETVAEGVERAVQRDQLREERCEFGQGFLFAKPLPAEEAERLLETYAAAPVPAHSVHDR